MNNLAHKKIVITGGHHNSAIPVIEALRSEFPNVELYWFGHKYSLKGDTNPTMEYLQITALGIPFYELKAGKVYKTFDIGRLLKVPFGFLQALYLLIKLRPNLIMSFGGYLAVPTVIAGYILGIPAFTHEQTLVVGYANKVIANFAKKIFISWPTSEKFFDKAKVVYSGLPLRPDIFTATTNNFTLTNSMPTLYITAGKTGSHKLNEVIQSCMKELLAVCNIIHQCGDHSVYNDYDALTNEYLTIKHSVKGVYVARKFVLDDEIGEVFSKANIVVSRAGAHIVSELLALEKPAILIPIPWVSHNEQNINADFLVKAGLSMKLDESELSKETLCTTVTTFLANLSSYKLVNVDYKNYIKSDSTRIIVSEIRNQLKV